jgi:methanogenic corrinoid protein MtbC1
VRALRAPARPRPEAKALVEAIREQRPDVLGMPALLTTTMPGMGTMIQALEEAGVRGERAKELTLGAVER